MQMLGQVGIGDMKMEKNYKKEKELEELKHKNKMEEIEFEFDCKRKFEAIKHDKELERQRIRNASIQNSINMKNHGR